MRFRALLIWAMTAAALALPAVASDLHIQVGGTTLAQGMTAWYSTLEAAYYSALAYRETYDETFFHIYSDQSLPTVSWDKMKRLRFIGEKTGTRAVLDGNNQDCRINPDHDSVRTADTRFENLTIQHINSHSAKIFTFVKEIKNCEFYDIQTDSYCIFDNSEEKQGIDLINTTFKQCHVGTYGLFHDCARGDHEFTISGCTFENCSGGEGGIFHECGKLLVTDTTFNNCKAVKGGVDCHVVDNTVHEYRRCRFLNCEATGKGYKGDGGALWSEEKEFSVYDSVFYNCKSGGTGAAIEGAGTHDDYRVCNCTFYECTSSYSGDENSSVHEINCYNSIFFHSSPAVGGGDAYNRTYGSSVSSDQVFEDTTNFKLKNTATTTGADAVIDKGSNSYRQKLSDGTDLNGLNRYNGTVDIGCTEYHAPPITEDDLVVKNSEASGAGSFRHAIESYNNGPMTSGTITFEVGTVTVNSQLNITKGGLTINSKTGTRVKVVCEYDSQNAIYVQANADFNNLDFVGNSSRHSRAIHIKAQSTIRSCTFTGFSYDLGGAIYHNASGLYIHNCRFDNCKASQYGGGIYCTSDAQTLSITDSTFMNCTASHGACIAMIGCTALSGIGIANCSFLGNYPTAAILLHDLTLPEFSLVARCTFAPASGTGAGIYSSSVQGKLHFVSCLARLPNANTFFQEENRYIAKRSLFACPIGNANTGDGEKGCYVVPEDEWQYVLADKVTTNDVSGVKQSTYILGEHSVGMEFPGWFIGRDLWNGASYKSHRSDAGHNTLLGSPKSWGIDEIDLFGQNQEGREMIPITGEHNTETAPPVGAVWNVPTYDPLARLTFVDVFHGTTNVVKMLRDQKVTAATPTRSDATFNGWWTQEYSRGTQYFDGQGGQLAKKGDMPTTLEGLTLYAGWTGHARLRFINSFSSTVEEVPVLKGEPIPDLPGTLKNLTHEGMTFQGWYDGGYLGQGKQWYDAAGNPVLATPQHFYPNDGDTYLYSGWDMHGSDIHLDPTIEVSTTTNISHETFVHHATNALFHVTKTGTLYLNSVTITGDTWCVFLRESAIRNDGGTVVCSNCNFASLFTPTNFGAAYCGYTGTAKFINCSFVDNQARTGGAIYAKDGTVNLLNCTIAGNKTLLGGEDNPGGAAIAGTGNASWQIAACTITSNMAASAKSGAGMWINGGSGFLMQISDSVIQGNGKVYEHVYGNVDSGYTRSYACSYYGSKYVSYVEASGVAEHPTAPVTELGARRTVVCDGVTQTFFAPMNGARTGGQRLWTKDCAEFSCQDTSPGSGWREVTWDILGEQLFETNKISLRPSYIGSRRRNVLQDLIDATPSTGALEDMTLVVPEGTYDPVDITRPISILCDRGEATVEASGRMSCVTISNAPSPVIIGGLAFREGGGASGGGVCVKSGGANTVISNCTFDVCATTQSGGGVCDSNKLAHVYFSTFRGCSSHRGGGIYGSTNIIGCTFRNCAADWEGGGVSHAGSITNATFAGCSTLNAGGGVHTADSVALCTFEGNAAADGGGLAWVPRVSASTFTGNVATNGGGGVYGVEELRLCALTGNVATNWGGGAYAVGAAHGCTFRKNSAGQYGGGLCGGLKAGGAALEQAPAFAQECAFEENVVGLFGTDGTDVCGGGAYSADAMGCVFRKNKSFGRGGGIHVRGVGNARACLFLYNQAVLDGGAVVGDVYNCTFVRNYGNGSIDYPTSVQDADSYTSDSLFYNNALPTHPDSCSMKAKASYFYNASAGNYHLRESAEVATDLVGSSTGCRRARENGWTDPENADLVNVVDGVTYFYIGCYGFVPAAAAGVTVNGMEDSYEDTNLKTSLREAIANAQANPEAFVDSADGKIHIKFDEDKLFRNGQLPDVVLFLEKSGVALTNFTRYPLVIEPPAGRGITITGENEFRPFYILPGNRLELVNVTILNATGGHYAMGDFGTGADGGAVINAGTLVADGCAFRNCRGGLNATGVPAGSGGAIYAVSGSTTAVTRCTFDGCRAARGGAVFQEGGSFATYQTTTFSGNRAQDGGAVISGLGGAAYVDTGADAAFVHCTLAGNEADAVGAGVCAKGDPNAGVPVVRFLNSFVLGNHCGTEADDIYSSGSVTMVRSWYGAFPNAAQRLTSTEGEGGKAPADAFAEIGEDGLAVAATQVVNHVVHTFYGLREDAGTDGYYAWSTSFGVDIGYATSSTRPTATLRGSAQGARRGSRITVDQFGQDCGTSASLPMGAANKKGASTRDLPSDVEDPLCVTSENTLEKVFAYAALATPKDGLVTITFDPSVKEVSLPGTLSLESFTAAQGRTLRIVGDEVTITSSTRAFLVGPGNRLELAGLTITTSHQGSGGAIRVDRGSLVAECVTFDGCRTRAGNPDEYSDGGAVALIGDASSATFRSCAFDACSAEDGWGDAVYRETEDIRFLRCTFDDAERERETDIDLPMRVRVEHSDGSFDLFAETLPALKSELRSGDVVAILDANAQDVADLKISLPAGVTVRDDTAGGVPSLMAAVKAALTASVGTKNWYSVVETPDSVGVRLNENAVPELTGDGAEVDLSADAGTVTVTPANVKPNLWYALEHAETPSGPYTVEEGGWVQANPDGTLPKALTAPAAGTSGFYRIVVKESK